MNEVSVRDITFVFTISRVSQVILPLHDFYKKATPELFSLNNWLIYFVRYKLREELMRKSFSRRIFWS